jgi:hypothetical protein
MCATEGVRIVLRQFDGNKSGVWACINCSMHNGSNNLTIKVGVCCGFPLFVDVEFHSHDRRCFEWIAIHHVESLEDSSNIICLRYIDLAMETLVSNVEAEELL